MRQDSRDHCSDSSLPVIIGRIPHATSEATARHQLPRTVTVGTRHSADGMVAGPHLHLGLSETTIEVVTGVIVANHRPPPGGIVGAATRFRRRHVVSATNVNMSVLRHAERANGTGTILVDYDCRRGDSWYRYGDCWR